MNGWMKMWVTVWFCVSSLWCSPHFLSAGSSANSHSLAGFRLPPNGYQSGSRRLVCASSETHEAFWIPADATRQGRRKTEKECCLCSSACLSSETSLPPGEQGEVLLCWTPTVDGYGTNGIWIRIWHKKISAVTDSLNGENRKKTMLRVNWKKKKPNNFSFHQNYNFSTLTLCLVFPLTY